MSNTVDIQEIARDLRHDGPDRVIVTEAGFAVSSSRASEKHGIKSDVVFIRDDGWTLGAPTAFERLAFEQWEGLWIGFLRAGENAARPIAEYQRPS